MRDLQKAVPLRALSLAASPNARFGTSLIWISLARHQRR
jgi:hypothetical protein